MSTFFPSSETRSSCVADLVKVSWNYLSNCCAPWSRKAVRPLSLLNLHPHPATRPNPLLRGPPNTAIRTLVALVDCLPGDPPDTHPTAMA